MTVHCVDVADLLTAAREVGIRLVELAPGDPTVNLYVWTAPDGSVLYIGKAVDGRRLQEETAWKATFDPKFLDIGFVALLTRHDGVAHPLRFDGLDPASVAAAVADWNGDGLAELVAQASSIWAPERIEQVLIRMMVLAGAPVANSVHAGQWESGLFNVENILAAVAVINSEKLRVPGLPPQTQTAGVLTE